MSGAPAATGAQVSAAPPAVGPAEYLVIGFERSQASGDVIDALVEATADGATRILDLVFVVRDALGEIDTIEVEEVGRELELAGLRLHLGGLATEEDIAALAECVPPGSLAAIALVEHRWMGALARRLRRGGAELVHAERITARTLHDHLAEHHPPAVENGDD